MFKYIKGIRKDGAECLVIWLNNLPIIHIEQASVFGVKPTHGGFCNLNKDALKYNFFTAYGSAPSIGCNSDELDFGRLASFIREGHIEFDEDTGVAIITPKPHPVLSRRFNLFKDKHGDAITLEEMVEKYEQIFKRLYPNI